MWVCLTAVVFVWIAHRFTNVKREADATTILMRQELTSPNVKAMGQRVYTNEGLGDLLFNCGLFRYFGSKAFLNGMKWVSGTWDPEDGVKLAKQCWKATGHAFTSAYCKPHYNSEKTGLRSAVLCYQKVCLRY